NRDYSEMPDELSGTHMLSNNAFAGGKGINHTFQLANLGARVAIFGCIGKDSNGTFLKDKLKELDRGHIRGHRVVETYLAEDGAAMTGITFFSPTPDLRYFHVSGANNVSIEWLLDRHEELWATTECCLIDLETRFENVVK